MTTLCQAQAQGLGDLAVTPTHVTFEGRVRTAEITLTNKGGETATYRISFIHTRMDESGKVAECEKEAGTMTAEDLVRYSPREVVLAAGAFQVVRLQLRKPEDLPPGEYRSQMLFRAVPPPQPVDEPEPDNGKQELSISIRPIFGVSIPVVVHNGLTTCKVDLADLALVAPAEKGAPSTLSLRLLRDGNQSAYGTLRASWDAKGGKMVAAGELACAVYHPLPSIRVSLPLDKLGDKTLAGGTLKVSFTPRDAKEPTAQASLDLP